MSRATVSHMLPLPAQYIEATGCLPSERVTEDDAASTGEAAGEEEGGAGDSAEPSPPKEGAAGPVRKKPPPRHRNYWEHTNSSMGVSMQSKPKKDLGMVWLERAQQLLGNRTLFPPPAHLSTSSLGGSAAAAAPAMASRHVRLELVATVGNMMAVRSKALGQTHTALRHLETALKQEARLHAAAEEDVGAVLEMARVAHRGGAPEEVQDDFRAAYSEAVEYLASRRRAFATCHLNAVSVLSDMAKHAGATHHSSEAVRLLTTSSVTTSLPWESTSRLVIGTAAEEGEEEGGGEVIASTASTGGIGVASSGTLLLLAQALFGLAIQQEAQKKYSAAVKSCDQGRKALRMMGMRKTKERQGDGSGSVGGGGSARGVGGTSLTHLPHLPAAKTGSVLAPMDHSYVHWLTEQFNDLHSTCESLAEEAESAKKARRTAFKASTYVQPGRRTRGTGQDVLDRLVAATSTRGGPGGGRRRPGSRPSSRGSAYGGSTSQPLRRTQVEVAQSMLAMDPSTGRPRRSKRVAEQQRTAAERLDAPGPVSAGKYDFAPAPSSAPESRGVGFRGRRTGGSGGGGRSSKEPPVPDEIQIPGVEPTSIKALGQEARHAGEAALLEPGSLDSITPSSVTAYKGAFTTYDAYTQDVIDAPPETFKEFERVFLPPSVDLHFPPLVPEVVAAAQSGTTSATGFAAPAMLGGGHRRMMSKSSTASAGGASGASPGTAEQKRDEVDVVRAAPEGDRSTAPSTLPPVDAHGPPGASATTPKEETKASGGDGSPAATSQPSSRSRGGIQGDIHLVRAQEAAAFSGSDMPSQPR